MVYCRLALEILHDLRNIKRMIAFIKNYNLQQNIDI